MKILIALVALISTQAFAARTLDQELSRTRERFELKTEKKARRDAVKAKYKPMIEALKAKQKAEIEDLSQ